MSSCLINHGQSKFMILIDITNENLNGDFFNLYNTYKAKYPVSKNVDLKCAFYAVYHEIYCFISSGSHTEIILKTAVNRLHKEFKKAGLL